MQYVLRCQFQAQAFEWAECWAGLQAGVECGRLQGKGMLVTGSLFLRPLWFLGLENYLEICFSMQTYIYF